MKSKKFKNIDILIDNPNSWMWQFLDELKNSMTFFADDIRIFKSSKEIENGDILFILSCDRILKNSDLSKHKNNIVIHESDLPIGKGWSPLSWQVESGKNEIPITLFEASEALDSGDWYLKDRIILDGFELIEEIRFKQFQKTKEMILNYLQNHPMSPNPQIGAESIYQKRTSKNQELDAEKSIKEQFSKLRICDNDRYPAHFFIDMGGGECKNLFSRFTEKQSDYIYMKYLVFDTNFFGKPSFAIDLPHSSFTPNEMIRDEFFEYFQKSFLTLKATQKTENNLLFFLQSCGLYFVDTELILKHNGKKQFQDIEIVEISSVDELDLKQFDGVFSHSRFHLDANIPNKKADFLWKKYLENFKIDAENKIFVALKSGGQVGYIGVKIEKQEAILFSVAVTKKHTGEGIGSKMIQSVIALLEDKAIKTEVYARNIDAVRFYIKNGFDFIEEFRYVYHRY